MECFDNYIRITRSAILAFGLWVLFLVGDVLSDACSYRRNGVTSYVYCEHGCCGTEDSRTCCSYKISTSVLVVACVVSGLVVVALIASVVVCCYKNYKDKQQTRVRNLQREQARNVPVRPAEPPKPPAYTAAPPEYSEQMPVSHYRPVTRQDNVPYNTRFSGMAGSQVPRNTQRNAIGNAPVYMSSTSGAYQQTSEAIPGSIFDAPPRYSSLDRGMTSDTINTIVTNHRHRRVPPDTEVRNNTTIEEEGSVASRTDTESTLTRDTSTAGESRIQTRSGRSATRIPQRVHPTGRQSSATSVTSRMATRSSVNAAQNRNTTLSEIEDSEVNNLADI